MTICKIDLDLQRFEERKRRISAALGVAALNVMLAHQEFRLTQAKPGGAEQSLRLAQENVRLADEEYRIAQENLFGPETGGKASQAPLEESIMTAGVQRMRELLHQAESPLAVLLRRHAEHLLRPQEFLFSLAGNPKDASSTPPADPP